MKNIYFIAFFLFLISCTSTGLQKTDQKDFFTSNEQVIFDNDKKLFKYEFSINNFSKSTINNFAYSVVFLNSKGVAITSVDKFFSGAIEPEKAGRAFIYIDEFVRKNFKKTSVYLKKWEIYLFYLPLYFSVVVPQLKF